MNDSTVITPNSYLFGFVVGLLKVEWSKHCEDLPEDSHFIVNEYGIIPTSDGTTELVNIDNMEKLFKENEWLQEEPETVGWRYQFKITDIRGVQKFDDIAAALEDDGFAFKMEYEAAREYLNELVSKHLSKEDFFAGLF